ncbi:hypothetical protein FQA39_LY16874 [Lamprigera yunnana]|nr:hypothetical protein FQA39_LY16874 [Lamprigera yunnana]
MLVLAFVFCAVFVAHTSASAIPMWELLSKEEKLSYLYSMFAYQAEEFCEFSEMKNCNQELLKHGLNTLKGMTEDRLDTMDPYQRGASTIVWNSIMQGRIKQTKTPQTTTAKPNSYEDDLSISSDDFGSQSLASAKIENVYRAPPPKGFIYILPESSNYIIKSGQPEYAEVVPSTPLNDIDSHNPLTGPMVVRVYPDGTPVDQGPYKAPQDDDLKHHKMSQLKLPLY